MSELRPGIFPNIAMPDYLAMAAVSASQITTSLDRCPRAAWHESWLNPKYTPDKSDHAQSAGTIAHSILLEGSTACVVVIDPAAYPTKSSGNIPKGWTNDAIRGARDDALRAGKIPILIDGMAEIMAMVNEAQAFIGSLRESEPAVWRAFQPDGGDSEVVLVWDHNGTLCRIRPDRLTKDRKLIVDYKTTLTSSEPDAWAKQMSKMNFYVSANLYRLGVKALCGEMPTYLFLVQEQEAPYLCSLIGLDSAALDLGMSKVRYGLDLWQQCAKRGVWPGYPARACYPELPAWEHARWESTVGNLEQRHGIAYDYAKLWKDRGAAPRQALETDPA